jgi:hypothetical protein
VLAIEGNKKKTHHHTHETEYEVVRKEKHKRSKSPSGLVTFFAGAKRG